MTGGALTPADLAAVDRMLGDSDRLLAAQYPGDGVARQPVHTVYVPADRFRATTCAEWGDQALQSLREHAPNAAELAAAVGSEEAAVAASWEPLWRKLETEPIEDLRVDLEDGYGTADDDQEDADAVAAGRAVATGAARGALPPYCGIRFKSLEAATRRRGLRSLDLVLGAVLSAGDLPAGWVVTLPKVTSVAQVSAMVEICERLEQAYGLAEGRLRFEIQVETAQAVLGADGRGSVAPMVHAAGGRCSGLHFGTYDYTAAVGVAGGFQAMDHPAADYAKAVLQVAAAGTGVRVSDGSTNVLPVGDRAQVHAAWRLHARLVRRSFERGFYQGWDLHPAQLPTRFLATYQFFRTDVVATSSRLRAYLGHLDTGTLDEPATARALAGFLLRGVQCGAVSAGEAAELVGADVSVLESLARSSSTARLTTQ